MVALNIVLLALAQAGGGLLAAILLCALSWNLLKLVRHPEYGPCLAALLLAALLLAGVPTHHFLGMAAIFLSLGAVVLWPEGANWRALHPARSRRRPRRSASQV